MTELQAEAFKIEHKFKSISIVRPANVYGPYDNFDPNNAMVIPSLIYKAINQKNLTVWGNGTPIRDFIFSEEKYLYDKKAIITKAINDEEIIINFFLSNPFFKLPLSTIVRFGE